ncbi:MAG: hypothetical protein V5A88_00265 [Candidatus Thermoplasmatota archaeon]
MLTREQLLTLAVVISICGISALYLLSSQRSTVRANISEIDEGMIGSRVVTEGTVSGITRLPNTVLLELKEEDHQKSLTVAVDKEIERVQEEDKRDLKAGAVVEVEGVLEEYEGDLNLRVDELGYLSVLEKAHSSFTKISSLLEDPRWYEGMELKVRGDVVEKKNSSQQTELILSSIDEGEDRYELTCTMRPWEEEGDILGKPAVVKGEWRYENTEGRWVLKASRPPDVKTAG